MVQYTNEEAWSSFVSEAKDWWKIDANHYEESELTMYRPDLAWLHNWLSRSDSIRLFCRYQRGLLIYDTCTISELRRFCNQRKIHSAADIVDKRKLISILEAADDSATFERLKDLPTELRLHIYEAYFTSFDYLYGDGDSASRDFCAEPPILRSSHLLRNEATPLFYETTRFNLNVGNVFGDDRIEEVKEAYWKIKAIPTLFFRCGESEVIGRIKKIRVAAQTQYSRQPRRGKIWYKFCWIIDLGKYNEPPLVKAVELKEGGRPDFQAMRLATSNIVTDRLQALFDDIDCEREDLRLERQDAGLTQKEVKEGIWETASLLPPGWRPDLDPQYFWNWEDDYFN